MQRAATTATPSLPTWLEAEVGAVAWVDAGGVYRALSPLFARLLQADGADSLVGRARAEVLGDRLIPRLADGARLAGYLDQPAGGIELELRLAAPRPATWLYRSRPMVDAAGELLGWHESLIESEAAGLLQHQLAEQLEAYRALQEESLQAIRAKDEMIARVSHELRTPMTAIIGFCHMLLGYSGELSEVQRGYLQKVLKNATVQLQLLNNVLDLSRMASGPVAIMREPVRLEVVVAEAVESVEPHTWDRGIAVVDQVAGDLPTLTTDRLKLKQILINLLSNAVKYTEQGQVTVSARPLGDGVEVTVRDTGIGIAEEDLERIFEPYVKLHEGGWFGSVSTGLGLAIVRRLTDMLGGTLSVESRVGAGSVFTLALPPHPPDDRAAASAADGTDRPAGG